jgi:hypothetical protein
MSIGHSSVLGDSDRRGSLRLRRRQGHLRAGQVQCAGAGRARVLRGYENWQVIAVSQSGHLIEVILGNPEMIEAYQAGVPGNGKSFPDGAKMAKIHWNTKESAEAPAPTIVPDTLHDVDFMVRDSKRFADSGNWGYAQFNYDTVRHVRA